MVPEGAPIWASWIKYVELERDIAFTFESPRARPGKRFIVCSSAVPPLREVYQGQFDLKGVWAATKVFLGLADLEGSSRGRELVDNLAAALAIDECMCRRTAAPGRRDCRGDRFERFRTSKQTGEIHPKQR